MPRTSIAALCLLLAVQLRPTSPLALRIRGRNPGRIIGGTDANITDYPWQVSLQYSGYHSCGASIIGSQWALTAAHCLSSRSLISCSLRAGSSIRWSGGTVLFVTEIYPHEQYSDTSGDYDIGTMRTKTPFPLDSNVAIVKLPEDGYDPAVGLAVTATGWGYREAGRPIPDILQKVEITIVDLCECEGFSSAGRELTPRMLCAGEPGKSICFGDSGGPLVSGSMQVGIASWGSAKCEDAAAVYVNVGSLRSWVAKVADV